MKVAGATKDVSLAVSNRGVHPALTVDLCSNPANWTGNDPCSGHWGISGQKHIKPGESFRFTYGTVGGRVRLPDGKYVYFLADNLAFRRPAITLYAPTDRVPLVEGEIQIRHRHGHKIEVLCEADTQYKNITLGVFPK